MRALRQLAIVAILSLAAAACATDPPAQFASFGPMGEVPDGARIERPSQPLQCVAYARARAGISIYGDAWTWWGQAAGRYARGYTPMPGAVMVLDGYAGPERAHLAYVRRVVSSREIRVDHANWLDRGNIHLDDPVLDVSPDNDWSEVRVFNLEAGGWGGHVYDVRGFIGPADDMAAARLADRD